MKEIEWIAALHNSCREKKAWQSIKDLSFDEEQK